MVLALPRRQRPSHIPSTCAAVANSLSTIGNLYETFDDLLHLKG
jgi:hypothetical protein